jgi:hypothetical protein
MAQALRPSGQGELDRVLAAWRLSPASHQFEEPADEPTIAAAERALGRLLPDGLRALYQFSDGMAALGGNLTVEPLTGSEDAGLVGLSDRLREWGWPIPDEVLVFGGNGGSDQFGAWYPVDASSGGPTPVVMIGSVFEPACLALAGTDLPRFLLAWSAYYLIVDDAPAEALDALGLPASLRAIDEEAGLAPYFKWADPGQIDHEPDPYERGLDAAGFAELIKEL